MIRALTYLVGEAVAVLVLGHLGPAEELALCQIKFRPTDQPRHNKQFEMAY